MTVGRVRTFPYAPSVYILLCMRILHYNIFRGGDDRLPVIAKFVQQCNPDILGILEANSWEQQSFAMLAYFSHLAALPFTDISVAESDFSLVTLAKNQPTKFIHEFDGFHHALSGAVITLQNNATLAVLFYHANPYSEEARVLEVQRIAKFTRQFTHAVVMGDFNALSPHDPYNHPELLAALQVANIKKFGTTSLTFDAITAFEKEGMVDVAITLNAPHESTAPTSFNFDAMHQVPVRLDYAFVTPSLVPFLEKIEVMKNEITEHASDHYPLLLTLKDIV